MAEGKWRPLIYHILLPFASCVLVGGVVFVVAHGYIVGHNAVGAFHTYLWYVSSLLAVALGIWHHRLYSKPTVGYKWYRLLFVYTLLGVVTMTFGMYSMMSQLQSP